MLRAKGFGSNLVALAGIAASLWTFGCCTTHCENKLIDQAVVVNLTSAADVPYPVLYKSKGSRLLWFASNPIQITVHIGTKPIPFEGMTEVAGGACRGGGDCLIMCPSDQPVCASGKIAIKDQDLPANGITYEYDYTILGAKRASADPGLIIKP